MTREEPEIIDERWVEFYGDMILAALVSVDGVTRIVVPVRTICDVLGIDWSSQRRRILRDEVLG